MSSSNKVESKKRLTHGEFQSLEDEAKEAVFKSVEAFNDLKQYQTGRLNDNFRFLGIVRILQSSCREEDIERAIQVWQDLHPKVASR